jgi:hypothetical protein
VNFLKSDVLALLDVDVLRSEQADERRCIRAHVAGGMPVDEVCATWVDRHQDEIDRQETGMPLAVALAESMRQRYGRTGARENA